ncbi:MAG: CheR family methyltransferase [Nitrospirota bacterium]
MATMSKSLFTSMTDRDFRRLGEFISVRCGIKMPPSKRTMLEARVRKRLQFYGISSFKEYCDYLFSPEGMEKEAVHLIDVVTTNKTEFFREMMHFEYLVQNALPELIKASNGLRKKLNIWSAGCSTGEEPYSLAIVLNEFTERHPALEYKIIATDVSSRVLDFAKCGIYNEESIKDIPTHLKKKYFLRSKDKSKCLVKVDREIREKVTFRRLNLIEDDYMFKERLDIIFFRNVLIYFDRQDQELVLNRICDHMQRGGYLFVGHTETLIGLNVPFLEHEASAIYRKKCK